MRKAKLSQEKRMSGVCMMTRIERMFDDVVEIAENNQTIDQYGYSSRAESYPPRKDYGAIDLVDKDESTLSKIQSLISTIGTGGKDAKFEKNTPRSIAFSMLRAVEAACSAVDNVAMGKVKRAVCSARVGADVQDDTERLSNVEIAAKYALSKNLIRRVAIVQSFPIDQERSVGLIEDNPNMLMITVGRGKAPAAVTSAGNIRHASLPRICHEDDLVRIAQKSVISEIKSFAPDLILYAASPSENELEAEDETMNKFLTETLMHLADEQCKGRFILFLDGLVNDEDLEEYRSQIAAHRVMPQVLST